MWFTNMPGPQDQISLYGNQVAFVATSAYGQPVPLTVLIVSYAKKITVTLSVDDNIIPDPSVLCDDIEEAFELIKNATIDVKTPINN
ncbi:hypothetical protein like AT3G49190 [Hibiscus trionum]|uniref:O-acyltransferase WSD1 C-terminal domain-containing protein n=1 Tax=Hibiscus trionum TaxID=183268 RepID=A0A9W7JDC9_HIBTR|nr:hypothetical protein like AT3G49190 [Hibiscus trionum]